MNNLFSLRDVAFGDVVLPPCVDIAAGQVTFICGKSGRGKSTLLKLLGGMVTADAGTVQYWDKDVEEYDPVLLRREVLLCLQATYLFEGTVADNFEQYYQYRELPAPGELAMRDYLDICAIDFPLDADCGALSGGERHRIYLAICLSLQPKALLLDEPTSALDDATAGEVLSKLTAHCRTNDIDLVIVSHNEAMTDRFADKVIRLDNIADDDCGTLDGSSRDDGKPGISSDSAASDGGAPPRE